MGSRASQTHTIHSSAHTLTSNRPLTLTPGSSLPPESSSWQGVGSTPPARCGRGQWRSQAHWGAPRQPGCAAPDAQRAAVVWSGLRWGVGGPLFLGTSLVLFLRLAPPPSGAGLVPAAACAHRASAPPPRLLRSLLPPPLPPPPPITATTP